VELLLSCETQYNRNHYEEEQQQENEKPLSLRHITKIQNIKDVM